MSRRRVAILRRYAQLSLLKGAIKVKSISIESTLKLEIL
jgi:hypothetical protein